MVRGMWRVVHALRGVVRAPWFAARGPGRVVLYLLGIVMYIFFIETASGERVEWRGLSRHMAVRMFNATGRCAVAKSWGWAEEKEPLLIPLDMDCSSTV